MKDFLLETTNDNLAESIMPGAYNDPYSLHLPEGQQANVQAIQKLVETISCSMGEGQTLN